MKNITAPEISDIGCSGFCAACGTHHFLPRGLARKKALALQEELEQKQTLNIFSDCRSLDEELSTAALFGKERGKMFGVLECCNRSGQTIWLYAFSGQYQGRWYIPGWAPPLFDPDRFDRLNIPAESKIKQLGREIKAAPDVKTRLSLQAARKTLSRNLMIQIHDLYHITNFNSRSVGLAQAFLHPGGKPTGTGDCCAPKLLHMAARSDLAPISIAEFFFGKNNRSNTRTHRRFYPPCDDKCKPLLGYMLCGAEERKDAFGIDH